MIPVIMSGGNGSRLWPLSRQLNPKQFLALGDLDGLSMLQATIRRLDGIAVQPPRLICNEEHRFLAAEQLRQLGLEECNILLEPIGRNTAPALALVALQCLGECQDPLLLVLAADHLVQDEAALRASIEAALPLAEAGKLVTFAITPTRAETGYGYLQRGAAEGGGFRVQRFVEKPDRDTAERYLASGEHFWNSGMFLLRASRYVEELQRFRPDILEACRRALAGCSQDMHFTRIDREAFLACPDDSIDYAVMERTEDAVMVALDAGWSDIGSWSALWEASAHDELGNACKGDVLSHATRNSYVHAAHRLVATVGVEDLVIVETKDAVLVAHKDHAQEVKHIVEQLKRARRDEHRSSREVYRPWGVYDSIDHGQRYQVKHITVKPGAKLSVQMHHHRAEHWIVVSGTARVTNGDKTYMVTENQSTYIPIGQVHALENPGLIPLELIEVQSGTYLGEDDIVRFADRYGRVSEIKAVSVA